MSSFNFPITVDMPESISGMAAALSEVCDLILTYTVKRYREHRRMFKESEKNDRNYPKGASSEWRSPTSRLRCSRRFPSSRRNYSSRTQGR